MFLTTGLHCYTNRCIVIHLTLYPDFQHQTNFPKESIVQTSLMSTKGFCLFAIFPMEQWPCILHFCTHSDLAQIQASSQLVVWPGKTQILQIKGMKNEQLT
jgi:hypothetical protein